VVRHSVTGNPQSSARVHLQGTPLTSTAGTDVISTTGMDGKFSLAQVPVGTYTLSTWTPGYIPWVRVISVPAGQAVNLTILLDPLLIPTAESSIPTPAGTNVSVRPTTPDAAFTGAVITFATVSSPGATTIRRFAEPTTSIPNNAIVSDDGYFDISTSATFSGQAEVVLPYDPTWLGAAEPSELVVLHREGDTWVDRTSGVDPVSLTVRGRVASFSPLAVGKKPFATQAPSVVAWTQKSTLTAAVPRGARQLAVASAGPFQAGDRLFINPSRTPAESVTSASIDAAAKLVGLVTPTQQLSYPVNTTVVKQTTAGMLPWPCGEPRHVSQDRQNGNNSHIRGGKDEWAWDFTNDSPRDGWPIVAARPGVVKVVHTSTADPVAGGPSQTAAMANRIVIDNGDNTAQLYMHLKFSASPLVAMGQTVTAGTLIGYAGNTGNSTGPHLHYTIQEWNSSWSNEVASTNWYQRSVPSLFSDAGVPDGNPTFDQANSRQYSSSNGCRTLVFLSQPLNGQAGIPFGVQPAVYAVDASGSTDTSFTGAVTLAIKNGTGASGATIAGLTTVNAVNGTARFSGLNIDRAGTGYVLTANSEGVPTVDSSPFTVVATPSAWVGKGPDGGPVEEIVVDPSTPSIIYAAAGLSGVFRSSNGGASWSPANNGLENRMVRVLAIDPVRPSIVYAGTKGYGVYKSTDGGTSWNAINAGLSNLEVSSLSIDPTSPNIVYAGTFFGVFKSADGGATWADASTGLLEYREGCGGLAGWIGTSARALTIDPVAPRTLYVGTNSGPYKSTDGGGTWRPIRFGLPTQSYCFGTWINYASISALAIDRADPNTIYANADASVYKSVDGGLSWTRTSLGGVFVSALVMQPGAPNTLYAAGSGGVFTTTSGGDSWTRVSAGLPDSPISGLAINRGTPSTLYAATGEGAYQSLDGGGRWTEINNGLTARPIRAIAPSPSVPTVLYISSGRDGVDHGQFRSTDGGATWTRMSIGPTAGAAVGFFAIDPVTPTTIYAGTPSVRGLYKSTDGGISWTTLGQDGGFSLAIDPTRPSNVYLGSGDGAYKSTDGGATWSAVGSGLPTLAGVTAVTINPASPSIVYAATAGQGDGGVYRSTDGGGSWSSATAGLPQTWISALVIDPSTPSIIYAATSGFGVYKTTNSGLTWSRANTGLTNGFVQALVTDPLAPSTLYAGTGGGVFESKDAGGSWRAINTGLTDRIVNALAVTSTSLYAGTEGRGVFSLSSR
jgi:murein DD-endopeptidase MepM/ murein hydrolase activator NlpD/photosystem II stability/assembly factor-like uncharacterized protein